MLLLLTAAAGGATAQEAQTAQGAQTAQQAPAVPAADEAAPPALAGDFSAAGGEYLLGLGIRFGRHAVLGYGSVLGFDPFAVNAGVGYRGAALNVIGLYRQRAPGRLPYLEVRDRSGGLLLLEYAPPDPDLRLTLENQLFVGRVALHHAGEQVALYDLASASLDLLADYDSRITLVADLSTLQLLEQAAGAYGVGIAAPMQFLDRRIIVAPRVLHSGLTGEAGHLAADLIGYRFGDFSVGRLFGLLEGVGAGLRNATGGTTALVLNLEYRLHFLRASGVPIVDGIFVAAFADGGLFWMTDDLVADFVVGGGLGIDWLRLSVSAQAGYHHADSGLVWGIDLTWFR